MKYLKLFEQINWGNDPFGEEIRENLNRDNVIIKIENNYIGDDPEDVDYNKDIPIFFYRKKDRSIIDDASQLFPGITKLYEFDNEIDYDNDEFYFGHDHILYAFPFVTTSELREYFRKLGFEVE